MGEGWGRGGIARWPAPSWAVLVVWVGIGMAIAVAARAATEEAAAPAAVERVRYEADTGSTRVVVLLSRQVPYEISVLSGDPSRGSQRRIVLDLSNARLGRGAMAPIGVEDGLLQGIRTGQFTARTARVVLDMASVTKHSVTVINDPPRIVIDILGRPAPATAAGAGDDRGSPSPATEAAPSAETAAAGRSPRPPPQEARAVAAPAPGPAPAGEAATEPVPPRPPAARPSGEEVASVARPAEAASAPGATRAVPGAGEAGAAPAPPRPVPKAGRDTTTRGAQTTAPAHPPVPRSAYERWRIVLDPGHGGQDPGATGVDGVLEKDVTLAIAKRLKEKLAEHDNLTVLLTRDRDVTRSLAERTAFANARSADLFISIHTNADQSGELHGIETYTLNNTDDRATIRLAKMENGVALRVGGDLSFILSDLVQRGKEEESIALAQRLQSRILTRVRAHYPDFRNLGVKKGPFYVLVGAYMPCVLVETSFLSHPVEGRRLASEDYQTDIAEGLYNGVMDFLGDARLAKTL